MAAGGVVTMETFLGDPRDMIASVLLGEDPQHGDDDQAKWEARMVLQREQGLSVSALGPFEYRVTLSVFFALNKNCWVCAK